MRSPITHCPPSYYLSPLYHLLCNSSFMSSWLHGDDSVFYVNIWKGGSGNISELSCPKVTLFASEVDMILFSQRGMRPYSGRRLPSLLVSLLPRDCFQRQWVVIMRSKGWLKEKSLPEWPFDDNDADKSISEDTMAGWWAELLPEWTNQPWSVKMTRMNFGNSFAGPQMCHFGQIGAKKRVQ